MHKEIFTDLTLFPTPVIVVAAGSVEEPFLSTYIWISQFNSDPIIFGIGMKPKRNTYAVIKDKKAFSINIPNENLIEKVDLIGTSSSSEENKPEKYNLKIEKAKTVDSIVWKECPIIYECEFIDEIEFPDHNIILGKAKAIWVEDSVKEGVTVIQEELNPILASYTEKNYYSLGKKIKPWKFTRYKD